MLIAIFTDYYYSISFITIITDGSTLLCGVTGALNTKVLIARSLSFMVSSGKVIWNKKSNALLPRQGKSEAVFLWWWLRNINLIIFVFVSESINVVSRGETRARNGVRQFWRINNQQQPNLNKHWLPPRSCDCQSPKIIFSSLSDPLIQLRMQWNSWPRDWTRQPRRWPQRRPSPRPRRPRTRARRCPTWPASRTRSCSSSWRRRTATRGPETDRGNRKYSGWVQATVQTGEENIFNVSEEEKSNFPCVTCM